LLNWPECLSLDFPKVALEGEGEQVAVQVHVIGFHVLGGGVGPNFSVITACRQKGEGAAQPLLMVDIGGDEPGLALGFNDV